jgi:type I restriction enzyme, S subunit
MMDSKEDLDNLPQGWSWTKIGEICELINGKAFKSEDWSSNGLPIIRIQNLNNINAEFNYYNFDLEAKYIVEDGQLLFAWSGTPGTSFGAHIWTRGKGVLNQHIFKVNINENYINKKYFRDIINYNVTQYIKKAHGTAGLAHITKNKFESSFIPLPPLSEQHRIVARIEELFSRLDAGVEGLQKAKAQLKRYRQAVLKAAVEGRLTEDWRKTYPDVEPAEKLLERILQTRTALRKKHKQPEAADPSDLPELPKGWLWASLDQLSWDSSYGTSEKCDYRYF